MLLSSLFCFSKHPISYAIVTSTTSNIHFDINADGQNEMTLNTTGLGIATSSPSSNLHVQGNVIITGKTKIGDSSTPGVSDLEVSGTIGFNSISYTAGSNTLGNASFFLVDTSAGNVSLNLPDAASYTGRVITIKRTSILNSLYISGAGNLLDNYTTLEFLSGNLTQLEFISNGSQWYNLNHSQNEIFQEIGYQNLYLWWKLDETSGNTASSADSSSHSGNLTNNLSFTGNSFSGPLDNALLLSNTSDSIIHETSSLSSSAYAYSFWFKSSYSPNDSIDHDPVISGPAGFCWASTNTLYSNSAYHKLNDGSYVTSSINTTLSANTWYHLAVSWDGSNLKSYLNGNYESGNTATSWSGAANIIASHSGSFSSANLLLDDIRYYAKALDAESIYSLYHAGSP